MTEVTPLAAADAVRLAELAEAETRYRLRFAREMYAAGRADGWREGYADAGRDMARRWDEIARPAAHGRPPHAVLERRRWGPGGREHFADPRPGDFPGTEVRAA